jgi:ketosteroid isomerase-like protein
MSKENVEVVRRAYEEFSQRGPDEELLDTFWAPDIVFDVSPAGVPGLGTYRGHEEVMSFFDDWFGVFPFEEWEQEVEEIIDCGGDRVLALAHQRGRGSGSGAPAELEFAQLYTLRDGKFVRVETYLDHKRALEAAGLQE